MNNQLIIDMIETAASHLPIGWRGELYHQLDVVCKSDIPEMIHQIKNEGLDVIDWNDVDDIKRVADILDNQVDGYDVFKHTTNQGHRTYGEFDEMARVLRECEYMATAPMYDRLQSAGIYHGHQQLHELLAHDGMMVLPTTDRYLEDSTRSKENPLGDEWHDDFTKALDHFWSGHGSELNSEKTKFIMRWLAEQV